MIKNIIKCKKRWNGEKRERDRQTDRKRSVSEREIKIERKRNR